MDCIQRRTHSIVDILRDSKSPVPYHYTKKGECPYRGTCDRAIFQRVSTFLDVKFCMYDYTSVNIHHNLKYFTRLRTILHIDRTNTKLKTLETVSNSNDVWQVVTDLRDPMFNVFSHEFHEVPERIALDRAQCFEFDMYVFLQNSKCFLLTFLNIIIA